MKKRIFGLLMALILLFGLALPAAAAAPREVTVLFTHDLHSHLLPAANEDGSSYGGYARLKTVIDEQKALYPNAVLVDGGDFSMGSLFQTVYATDAAELRVMGAMGYDVTTFGNHEYDYRANGLADMLNAALDSGEPLPQIVASNYLPPVKGSEEETADSRAASEAMERYGVQDYTVIKRGGVNFAVFGIFGKDAHACAPMSGMVLEDPVETAKAVVAEIEANVAEPRVVVCLSHSGIWDDPEKSEDELLAAGVDGIDLIVSGHTHSTLPQPIQVNDTYIVSCGDYSRNLGVVHMNLTDGEAELTGYELIPVNDSVSEDGELAAKIEGYKKLVEENYLSRYGDWTYDTVLAENPYSFGGTAELDKHQESLVGNIISDAYRWIVEETEGADGVPVDFAVTGNGVVRESLATGKLTVADVFNVSSLGIGADSVPGYPLVSVYLTGKDLKNAFEVDASVTALMSGVQLYFTGMTSTFNPNRMILNKVTDCAQILPDGTTVEIEDEKLYRVVTGLYLGQMLGSVNDLSYGILEITPRDAQGNPVEDIEDFILHDAEGNEIKEWYALAAYLQHMGVIDEQYASVQGRKIVDDTLNPVSLLKNWNWITWLVLAIVLVLILVLVLIVRAIVRKVKKRKK